MFWMLPDFQALGTEGVLFIGHALCEPLWCKSTLTTASIHMHSSLWMCQLLGRKNNFIVAFTAFGFCLKDPEVQRSRCIASVTWALVPEDWHFRNSFMCYKATCRVFESLSSPQGKWQGPGIKPFHWKPLGIIRLFEQVVDSCQSSHLQRIQEATSITGQPFLAGFHWALS